MSDIKTFIEETKELVDKKCISKSDARKMMRNLADKFMSNSPFNLKGMRWSMYKHEKTIKDYLDNNNADSQK